ncbi:hypothetical protein BST27_28325 [Mycobacterium intermedium]|uniref:Lipoprotein LpqH n=1 Tax=Mycobacterium intermedium TaxID=28445 RepID=A0A1E3SJP6_MYCIE|nr:lipoprotein LpqH [Mycobacterium intermedium]ODR02377.1 hypothetical protein BHQ20_04635 [Mycobacterium intermedium]OPE48254.1 hypothetical protein BV508_18720 [Mycobacterium intermedium]ORA94144.1 hypothetical protein BST27_28325 [Mycobacterium intermedium]
MKRAIAVAIGTLGCASILVGCSSGGGGGHAASPSSAGGGDGKEKTTKVEVGGAPLAGVDPASVTCVKQGGKINIGSGTNNGQQALAVVMTDGNPPTVDSLAMVVDGNALSVANSMGQNVGEATVSVEGKTYTITGKAQGADLKNPMAGMITKDFNIKVSCG